jgi:hypothetical protein
VCGRHLLTTTLRHIGLIFGVQTYMPRLGRVRCLALATVVCAQFATSQSPLRSTAVKTTPPGASVELATTDGRTTYHLGEEIGLVTRYRSTIVNRYLLETAVCPKYLATADTFNRKPGKTQPVGVSMGCYHKPHPRKGWAGDSETPELAVDTLRVVLGSDPVELWSPGYLNYSQLGDHTVNITSHRVYPLDTPPVTATMVPESCYELTSNTVHITIIPADADWQRQVLAEIMPALRDRKNKDPRACSRLRDLTSPESTAERIYQLRTDGPCRDRVWFHTPLDIEELHKLFRNPKFPVSTEVLDQLAEGFVRSNHPELDDWDNSYLSFEEYQARFDASFEKGRSHYTDELLTLLPGKTGVAARISAQTADVMNRSLKH